MEDYVPVLYQCVKGDFELLIQTLKCQGIAKEEIFFIEDISEGYRRQKRNVIKKNWYFILF